MANLSKMKRKDLEQLIKDATKALDKIEKQERQDALKAAEAAAAKFGFKLTELTGGAKAAAKASGKPAAKKPRPAKYANPADPAQTWSGMGRQPAWYRDAITAGTDPKTLEV